MPIEFSFDERQLPLYALAALLLVAGLWILLRLLERRRQKRIARFVEAALAPRLLPGYDARVRRPLGILPVAGLFFLLLALAEPRWGESWVEVQQRSRDVLLLLDTSESMNAVDTPPSRLVRAKQKLRALIERSPGDRFGIVAFSGGAVLHCPFTSDQRYVITALDNIDTDTLSEEGTDIAAALDEARSVFEEDRANPDAAERGERAIILLSDGEQVDGDALRAAQDVRDHAPVFVVGVGDPQGAMVEFPKWMRDARYFPSGQREMQHLSVLDEQTLSQIALTANGAYVRATSNNDDVEFLHQQLGQLKAAAVSEEFRYRLMPRFQWPLALGIACFMAEGLWIAAMPLVRRWRMQRAARAVALAVAGIAFALPAAAQPTDSELARPNGLLRAGEYEQARAAYEELLVEHPESPVLAYGIAASHYAEGLTAAEAQNFDAAAASLEAARDAFAPLSESGDAHVAHDAALAHATALAHLGEIKIKPEQHGEKVAALRESVAQLESLMTQNPDDAAAQRNLLRARYLLKQALQNPPPKKEQPDENPPTVMWNEVSTELPGKRAVAREDAPIVELEDAAAEPAAEGAPAP